MSGDSYGFSNAEERREAFRMEEERMEREREEREAEERRYDENARLRALLKEAGEALDWSIADIEARTRYTKENQFGDCLKRARSVLQKIKAAGV